MKINIAENLKRLRKERNITQEKLAEFIGVSFQAVSKWERDEGYPDITLLPVLANFFGVTTDELIGMNEIKDKQKLDEILQQYEENNTAGKIQKCIDLCRDGLKSFPNDFRLMMKLADSLGFLDDIDWETRKKNLEEAIEIGKRILEHCTDSEIRNYVHTNLCFHYYWIDDKQKAVEETEKLPHLFQTQETTLPCFKSGEELTKSAQSAIQSFSEALRLAILELADVGNQSDQSWTSEQRIEMLDKANQIYRIIYDDGDFHFANGYISLNYHFMAVLSLQTGKTDEALAYLEKAAEYAIAKDNLPPKIKHTSLLVNTQEHDVNLTSKNYTCNDSAILLEMLKQEKYDVIRNDERFVRISDRLKEVAR